MLFLPDDVDKGFGVCSHCCDAAGDDDHDSGDLSDHESGDLSDHESGDLSDHESGDLRDHESGDLSDHESGDLSDHESGDLSDHESGDLSDHDSGDHDGDDDDNGNDGDGDGDGDGDHHDGSDDNEALDSSILQRKSLSCDVHHLHEELYSSQLLRLWRTGADTLCYRADEDDDFDVGIKLLVCINEFNQCI